MVDRIKKRNNELYQGWVKDEFKTHKNVAVFYMRLPLKLCNPLIFLVNLFKYTAHLEGQRMLEQYTPYDFAHDTPYF